MWLKRFGLFVWSPLFHRKFSSLAYLGSWRSTNHGLWYESTLLNTINCCPCSIFLVQHLYMGRSPPVFTEMRVLHQTTDDDHLVLELGMNFRTADDMSAILAVKLSKRLGFGMRAKLHLMRMHVEGKVLIGVKFLRHWPFLVLVHVYINLETFFNVFLF
ncbi:hypothetical protein CsSME_00052845 [Camellia sinensis var. sinensis]